jgi:hypothetical protein
MINNRNMSVIVVSAFNDVFNTIRKELSDSNPLSLHKPLHHVMVPTGDLEEFFCNEYECHVTNN